MAPRSTSADSLTQLAPTQPSVNHQFVYGTRLTTSLFLQLWKMLLYFTGHRAIFIPSFS